MSAFGSILNCRNPLYQAVYGVQGVIDNVYGLSINDLIKKKAIKDLITILGTGIGRDFDLGKLRYNKIIIATDADVDGSNIMSLLLNFFYLFLPELIESGKVYRATPPLYLMDLKSLRRFYNGREWLYSKREYYEMMNTIITNNCEMALETSTVNKRGGRQPEVVPMSVKDLKSWLNMNSEYKVELDNLSKKTACDSRVVEKVCYHKLHAKNDKDFQERIHKEFPEMSYDAHTCSLIGSWNGEFFSLICDNIFDRSARRFMEELARNKYFYVWYRNSKRNDDKYTRATIGEFLDDMDRVFNVKIAQRFKGLGEVEPDLLFRTSTNPKYRKLLQIRIKDVKKTMSTFELLHAKTTEMREARRQLIENSKMSYMDIDN